MAPDGPTCVDAVQTLKGGARAGENQIVARATTRYGHPGRNIVEKCPR